MVNKSFFRVFRILSFTAALACMISCSDNSARPSPVKETGRLQWPEITSQTKPWTRWWWPGSAVGKSDIDTMLAEYSDAGLGGMEVTTIYGARGYEDKYLKYLSPRWMDLFTYTLKEAGKKGLGIDLANASGWPFGGPWVAPSDACRYLAWKTFSVKGGESLKDTIKYVEKPIVNSLGLKKDISRLAYPVSANDSLQQYAFEQVRYPRPLPLLAVTAYSSNGAYINLTGKVTSDGRLDWVAPKGDWTVCAMFLGWHGKLVERAGPGGEGDVIDHFSAEATKKYLSKFDEAFKGHDVSGIRYYFNDSYEVDDAVGNSDWTEDFFKEFKSMRGYDLRPYMPELLGLRGDTDTSSRVIFDYRRTIGELLENNYLKTWQKWAADQGKGIRNQAHGAPANILDLYADSDVPETEGRSIIGMKAASSAAHVADRPLTSSESATWLNEHFRSTLGDVKKALDTYLLSGVNHIFYHGTCLSPDSAPWPGWLFYAAVHFQPTNSFWTDFSALNKYVARCQSFLQAGRPDNDILLFFDASDLLSERGQEGLLYHMNLNSPSQSLTGPLAVNLYNSGYSWDYITDNMILKDISVSDGKIVTKGGTSYKVIIVPQCQTMLLSTFRKLMWLAGKGATVIFDGGLPTDVPGLENLAGDRNKLKKLTKSLRYSNEGIVNTARIGKGRFMVAAELAPIIEAAGITRETMSDMNLQFIRRLKPDGGRYYFIRNASDSDFEGWVPLDAACGSLGIYNPMTGQYGYGYVRNNTAGKAEVFLKLGPSESLILETFAGSYSGARYSFYDSQEGTSIPVGKKWTVKFTKGGPSLPSSRTISSLGSWTKYGKDCEIFSGSAEYSTALDPVKTTADAWSLDLGRVCNSAAVYLNGKYLGTLLGMPFAITLTQAQAAAGGELVIRVSNSMENRISYMDRNGIPWRIFYNANIQPHSMDSRGEDGFFSAASWPVRDSGLLGPVTLKPLKVAEE